MYCVMRASVPSLHNVYRRYDTRERKVTFGMQLIKTHVRCVWNAIENGA